MDAEPPEVDGLDPSIVVADPAAEPDRAAAAREHQEALAEARVAIAAYMGHGPSRAALGPEAPSQPRTVDAWLLGLSDWDMGLVPLAGLTLGGLALEALARERPGEEVAPWQRRFDLARAFVEEPGYERAVALIEATREGPAAPAGDAPGAAAMRAVEQCGLLALNALGARYRMEVEPLVGALVSSTVEAGIPVPALAAAVTATVTSAVLGEP